MRFSASTVISLTLIAASAPAHSAPIALESRGLGSIISGLVGAGLGPLEPIIKSFLPELVARDLAAEVKNFNAGVLGSPELPQAKDILGTIFRQDSEFSRGRLFTDPDHFCSRRSFADLSDDQVNTFLEWVNKQDLPKSRKRFTPLRPIVVGSNIFNTTDGTTSSLPVNPDNSTTGEPGSPINSEPVHIDGPAGFNFTNGHGVLECGRISTIPVKSDNSTDGEPGSSKSIPFNHNLRMSLIRLPIPTIPVKGDVEARSLGCSLPIKSKIPVKLDNATDGVPIPTIPVKRDLEARSVLTDLLGKAVKVLTPEALAGLEKLLGGSSESTSSAPAAATCSRFAGSSTAASKQQQQHLRVTPKY
ncbi:hypothetical protein B0H15DRAFT_982303 [Mycena belliarum]|uniref:Uncharacterized protein n=1 Tax=Mycena belliarum TaxID=1033014 RepID=A0AAD6U431_9AGAR|nr:hypothetical protein B0H15DRAFT_982303 [Mycena belliae]